MTGNALDIYVGTRLTATLERDSAAGEYVFSYCSGAQDPVSLTMPVCDLLDRFLSLPPVLETSLPEGALLETIFRKMGKVVKLNDDFDILKLVGRNLIGRLVVVPSGESPESDASFTSSDRLVSLLRSPNSKDLVTQAMVDLAERTGISGILPKTFAMSAKKSRMAFPVGECILKTESDEFPGICIVEHVCLAACRAADLPVPQTVLSEDGKSLLVKRFDVGPDGERRGFEDFCALSNIGRQGKYQSSYESVAKIVSLFSTDPDKDSKDLFKIFAMMHLLRNGDAHLKNFGMVYPSTDNVRLSPVYDMVSTTPFIPGDRPALEYEGTRKWLRREDIVSFGMRCCGMDGKEALSAIQECIVGIGDTIPLLTDLCDRYPIRPVLQSLLIFKDSARSGISSVSLSGETSADVEEPSSGT